jgi:hypothetical protein
VGRVAVISLAAGVAGSLAARGHDADVEPEPQPA